MGIERPHASEIRGGLIADEMGLGKTMVMLATVVGSLKRAASFVSIVGPSEDIGSSSCRNRSKATLVIVPSSSQSLFLLYGLYLRSFIL